MPDVIISPTGVQGPRGNAVLTGSGAPSNTVGIDGDYYINTASYPTSAVLYGPRASGAWPSSGITLASVTGVLLAINNLSDVANTATARTNLGLGGAAVLNVGTAGGTVAAGNDARITGAAQTANNLSDLGSAPTARTNLAVPPNSRQILAGTGLTGGGDLTADRTLTVTYGTTTGTAAQGNDTRITGAVQTGAAAGGDLTGTYPNPTLSGTANVNTVVRANRLDQMAAPTAAVSLNSQKLTLVANGSTATDGAAFGQIPTTLPPNGSATGDLSGSYPSPSVVKVNGTSVPAAPAAGQILTATSSTTATWSPIGVPLKSGWYYPADGQGGNRTMAFNLLWIFPFDCQRAITISKLACNVTTAGTAGTTIRIGVYGSDGAGGIGNLIVDGGTVAGDSTGVKTITLSQAAGPDRLWLCAAWQGTNSSAPVLQAYSRALPYIGWSSFVQFPPLIAYQYTGITGALPSTLPTPTANENNNAPAVQFAPA